MIPKLKMSLIRVSESGLFHDSRKDVRLLAACINELRKKLNEVIEHNNKLQKIIEAKEIEKTSNEK